MAQAMAHIEENVPLFWDQHLAADGSIHTRSRTVEWIVRPDGTVAVRSLTGAFRPYVIDP